MFCFCFFVCFLISFFRDEEDSAVVGVDWRDLLCCHDFTVPHAGVGFQDGQRTSGETCWWGLSSVRNTLHPSDGDSILFRISLTRGRAIITLQCLNGCKSWQSVSASGQHNLYLKIYHQKVSSFFQHFLNYRDISWLKPKITSVRKHFFFKFCQLT